MKTNTKRQVTVGNTTLCSAVQNGCTLLHYYFLKVGNRWVLFDIRTYIIKGQYWQVEQFVDGSYEDYLQRQLRRAAEWLEK